MSQSPPTRRRWYQFGIGTMLLLVTVFAVWLGWELKFIRARQAFLAQAESRDQAVLAGPLGVYVPPRPVTVPIWRRWLGDKPADYVFLPPSSTPAYVEIAKSLFPEAQIYGADGTLVPND